MIKNNEVKKSALGCWMLDFKNIWDRASHICKVATIGNGLPWSLKEVWNSKVALGANSLRDCAKDLMSEFPEVSPLYIAGLAKKPPILSNKGTSSIFQQVLDNPSLESILSARESLRHSVQFTSEVIADVRSL